MTGRTASSTHSGPDRHTASETLRCRIHRPCLSTGVQGSGTTEHTQQHEHADCERPMGRVVEVTPGSGCGNPPLVGKRPACHAGPGLPCLGFRPPLSAPVVHYVHAKRSLSLPSPSPTIDRGYKLAPHPTPIDPASHWETYTPRKVLAQELGEASIRPPPHEVALLGRQQTGWWGQPPKDRTLLRGQQRPQLHDVHRIPHVEHDHIRVIRVSRKPDEGRYVRVSVVQQEPRDDPADHSRSVLAGGEVGFDEPLVLRHASIALSPERGLGKGLRAHRLNDRDGWRNTHV